MNMNLKPMIAGAVLLAWPLIGDAQTVVQTPPAAAIPLPAVPSVPGAVTLRLKFTPGEVRSYTMDLAMNGTVFTGQSGAGLPISNQMQMLMHQTVQSVRPEDGAATLISSLDAITVTAGGQTQAVPAERLADLKDFLTTVILPSGKVLSSTVSPAVQKSGLMPGMDLSHSSPLGNLGIFPSGPVKPGDTWSSTVAAGIARAQVVSHFTFRGTDMVAGKSIAHLDVINGGVVNAASAPVTGSIKVMGKVSGTGSIDFDLEAGMLKSQKNHLRMNLTLVPKGTAAGTKMRMTMDTTIQQGQALTASPGANAQ